MTMNTNSETFSFFPQEYWLGISRVIVNNNLMLCFRLRYLFFAFLSLLIVLPVQAATYANSATTFNWIDASSHTKVGGHTTPYYFQSATGGCGTVAPVIDDTITNVIPIGFNFIYGSMVFDSIRIMSNGRIHFVSTSAPLWDNTTCGYGSPVTQFPYPDANLNYTMRIYGNDLDPSLLADTTPQGYTTPCVSSAACYVSFAMIGTAPNRQFVVTWNNVPEWASFVNATGNYNLQLILNENGTFIYQYGTDVPGPQAALGQVGWQLSTTDYDAPAVGYPVPNTAILYFIPHPVVEYLMEQASWSGAGSVLDTSGYSRNGSPVGTAQTMTPGKVCRGATFSKTNINAINSGFSVPNVIGNSGTITFWYKANTAWSGNGTQDALLLDATTVSNQWFYLVRRGGNTGNGGKLRFVFADSTGTAQIAETNVNNIAAGTWEYITVTWNLNNLAGGNNDRMTIYVNGVQKQQTTFSSTTATLSTQIGNLFIGGTNSSLAGTGPGGTNNSADAIIDEFRAYNYEADAATISNFMTLNTGGCLDHYAITDGGTGLTCQLSQVTVLPQTASNSQYVDNSLVHLTTSDGTGTWSLLNGHGTLNSTGSNSGTATYLFNSESQVILGLTHPAAGTITAHVTDGIYSDTSSIPLVISACAVGKFNACEVTATRCTPTVGATAYANLYTKLANTAFALDMVAVQVSGALDLTFSKAVNVNLLVNNSAPTISATSNCPTTQLATIPLNGGAAVTLTSGRPPVGGLSVSSTAFSSVSPNYSAYRDVRVQFVCTAANCPPSGGTWCATDAFTVRPQSFTVSSTANADSTGTSATAAPVVKTGTAFPLTVNSTTVGYDGSPNITLTKAEWLSAPAAGRAAPGVGNLLGSFTTGATLATGNGAAGNFTYDDVGYFRLQAGAIYDSNYASISGDLGNGDCVSGTGTSSDYSNTLTGGKYGCEIANTLATNYFGRFIPDHLDTAVVATATTPMPCPTGVTCPVLYSGFVYSGEPFSLTVSARNTTTCSGGTPDVCTTQNYTGSFAKAETLTAWDAVGSTLTQNPGGGAVSNNSILATVFAAGIATTATPSYAFTTVPTVPTNIYLRATETAGDGVTSLRSTSPTTTSIEGGVAVASGQIKISNAYGSELLPLTLTATAQFYSSSGWATSSTDSLTPFSTSSIISNVVSGLSGSTIAGTVVTDTCANTVFCKGVKNFTLTNSAKIPGITDICINSPGYLLHGAVLCAPSTAGVTNSGRATFGVYKGNNSIIYMRENY